MNRPADWRGKQNHPKAEAAAEKRGVVVVAILSIVLEEWGGQSSWPTGVLAVMACGIRFLFLYCNSHHLRGAPIFRQGIILPNEVFRVHELSGNTPTLE